AYEKCDRSLLEIPFAMKERALFTTLLIFFFGMVGYSLTILFTPLFISPDPTFVSPSLALGLRTALFGVIMFLFPFGQFCSSPILGALWARYGRRPLLVVTVGVMILAFALLAWALQIKFIARLVGGLFLARLAGGNVVIAFSVVADLADQKD